MSAERKVPNYLPSLLALGQILPRGSVSEIAVLHDGWCAQLRGTGPCNCNPDVQLFTHERPRGAA